MPEVLWELGEHTLGKHLVLRKYLQAWYPILGRSHPRIAFVDGFAGPGEYVGGEEGSPVIAMKAFADHTAQMSTVVSFWFIELDQARVNHLRGVIEPLTVQLGDRAVVRVSQGRFDETLGGLLTTIAAQQRQLVPTFVMIDPFGVSGTPMSIIDLILSNRRSEVYISFMSEWINRFNREPGFEQHLDALFGRPDWRGVSELREPSERKNFLFSLYDACLRNAGARFVLRFELYRGRELVYAIFFASNSPKGCEKMKEAIWKVDPLNGTSFIPGNEAALDLFTNDPTRFQVEIEAFLEGRDWETIDVVEDWARTDATLYPCSKLKRALKDMESSGRIEVDAAPVRKRGTFPAGTRLRRALRDR
jgi:three-Cys-motif partner protein